MCCCCCNWVKNQFKLIKKTTLVYGHQSEIQTDAINQFMEFYTQNAMPVGLIKHLSTFQDLLTYKHQFFLSFRKQKHTLRNPCIQLPAIEKKNICVGIFFLFSGFWIISIFSPFEAPSPSLVTSMNLSSCQFFGHCFYLQKTQIYTFFFHCLV